MTDHDLDLRPSVFDETSGFETIHHRHASIHQHHIRLAFCYQTQGLATILCFAYHLDRDLSPYRRLLCGIQPDGGQLTALIGPEGGLSDEEYGLAEATGFQSIGFGPRILRTETAALAVVAAVQALSGDLAPG